METDRLVKNTRMCVCECSDLSLDISFHCNFIVINNLILSLHLSRHFDVIINPVCNRY